MGHAMFNVILLVPVLLTYGLYDLLFRRFK